MTVEEALKKWVLAKANLDTKSAMYASAQTRLDAAKEMHRRAARDLEVASDELAKTVRFEESYCLSCDDGHQMKDCPRRTDR